MNRALLKKSLHETKSLLLGCVAWLFLFSWVRVWIVSRMEKSRFESILEQFGDLVETASPVAISQLVSFTGRIALGYDDALIVFVILAFAITRGSDVVSGELGRGTLEIVLAQPVSRWQVLGSQAIVTVTCLALLVFATWLGNWVGIQTTHARVERPATVTGPLGITVPIPFAKPKIESVPMREEVDPRHLMPAALNLFCLALFFAGGTSLLSACDRYRSRTIGLAITFLVLQTVMKVIGRLVKAKPWEQLTYFSVLTAYEPQKLVEMAVNSPAYAWSFWVPTSHGDMTWGPLAYDAVLASLGIIGYIVAGIIFAKRDLPAPL
jgi:ABC-2 type transport system permease protein